MQVVLISLNLQVCACVEHHFSCAPTCLVDKQLHGGCRVHVLFTSNSYFLSLKAMSQSAIYATPSSMSVFRTWSHSQSPAKEQ